VQKWCEFHSHTHTHRELGVVLLERERLLIEFVLLCIHVYTQGAEVVRIPLNGELSVALLEARGFSLNDIVAEATLVRVCGCVCMCVRERKRER